MYAKGETCPSIMNWSKDGEIVFRCEMGEATNIVSYNNPSFPGEKSSLTLISGSIGHDFSKDPQ